MNWNNLCKSLFYSCMTGLAAISTIGFICSSFYYGSKILKENEVFYETDDLVN